MAYIGKKPEDLIKGNATYNAFTGDGSTTTFDVTNLLPDGGQFDVEVFVDNVRQEAGSSKSYTIGQDGSGDLKRVTFNVAPDDGAEIYVINPGRETAIISVADNTITTAKLQDDAVTTAKITDSNVTTAKIAADAITGAKIADDAINSEHITDGSVDNVHLAGSIANAKLANSSITINGTAVALGGSVTAGTDWQAVVVADGSTQLTAEAGKGYFLDTNNGVIEVNLPASPSRGDTFVFADYGGTFALNRAIIDTGGKLIDSTTGGVQGDERYFQLSTNGQVVELVFVDDDNGYMVKQNNSPSAPDVDSYTSHTEATGGTVTTSGDFKIHTFTGDGCFVVSQVGCSCGGGATAAYMVVAGGGGGGGSQPGYYAGGGGGAGGFREGKTNPEVPYTASPLAATAGITLSVQTYPITVGAGGSGGPGSPRGCGTAGSNSVFSTITSAGGGLGGMSGQGGSNNGKSGGNGGSGGGTGGHVPNPLQGGGSGNTPPVSPPQGQNGGSGDQGTPGRGGGGGGAGQAGVGSPHPAYGAAGGNGTPSEITGCAVTYSAGGKAGTQPGTNSPAGTNTGNGGASQENCSSSGVNGARGVVVIRYRFQTS